MKTSSWLVVAFAVVLVIGLLLGTFVLASAQDSQATLVVQQGRAKLTRNGSGLAAWFDSDSVVQTGQVQTVKAGDQISLPGGAAAELRFYDGSSVTLRENTNLVVQELATTEDSYRVRLRQFSGSTLNRVKRLLGAGDAFEINTPSSTVSVRGTEYIVSVLGRDKTWVAVNQGVVHVALGDQAVDVKPGEQLFATVGQPLQVQPQDNAWPQDGSWPPLPLPAIVPPASDPAGGSPETQNDPAAPAPEQAAPGQDAPAPGTSDETAPPDAGVTSSSGASGTGSGGTGSTDPATGSGSTSPGTGSGSTDPGTGTGGTDPGTGSGTTDPGTGTTKQVPGNPPGNPGNPTGGGEPPGQTKKNTPSDSQKGNN